MKKTQAKQKRHLMPYNHISLNTGHNYLVPTREQDNNVADVMADIIRKGGGPVPTYENEYYFIITANGDAGCAISLFYNGISILMGRYESSKKRGSLSWNKITKSASILHKACPVKKPAEPWLAVGWRSPLLDMLAMQDNWFASFEQCVVEVWLSLPQDERKQIGLKEFRSHLNIVAQTHKKAKRDLKSTMRYLSAEIKRAFGM